MDPISFKTKDNATVHGYLTKSKVGKSSESPTILHVHGGPEGVRDRWGFDVRTQMLASEGFNVLQINFRGSGGYGLDHQRFISANWDGVLNDLFDGMDYLHAKGEINKFNSCIYGGSYGNIKQLVMVTSSSVLPISKKHYMYFLVRKKPSDLKMKVFFILHRLVIPQGPPDPSIS